MIEESAISLFMSGTLTWLGVTVCKNNYAKVELYSVSKPIEHNKVYFSTTFTNESDNLGLHFNSEIIRSHLRLLYQLSLMDLARSK